MTCRKKFEILAVLLLVAVAPVAPAQEQEGAEKAPAGDGAVLGKLPESLENLLGRALAANPDIHVAEADMHYADARLRQVRLDVSHALVETVRQRTLRREAVRNAGADYERMQQLVKNGRAGNEELLERRHVLAEAEVALAETETMIRGLAGIAPLSGEVPDTLEKALSHALEANGEIALARAELARIDARIRQTRLRVTEEVTIAFQARRLSRHALDLAEARFGRTLQQEKSGLITEEQKLTVFQAVIEAEAELFRVEARLRYLLGQGGELGKTREARGGKDAGK